MKPYPIYLQYWFTWIAITGVYLLSFLLLFADIEVVKYPLTSLGLFTPYGPFTFFGTFSSSANPFALALFVLFSFSLFAFDKFTLYARIQNPYMKIAVNLIMLFAFSMAIELVVYGELASPGILLSAFTR